MWSEPLPIPLINVNFLFIYVPLVSPARLKAPRREGVVSFHASPEHLAQVLAMGAI